MPVIVSGPVLAGIATNTTPVIVSLSFMLLQKKIRIDSFLSEQLPDVSRARLKASIQEGLVTVNSVPQKKPAYGCKIGDLIVGTLPEPPCTTAEPEDLPLSVIYEDEDVLVINKAAGEILTSFLAWSTKN